MTKIFDVLPKAQDRQTILASATLPRNMKKFAQVAMSEDHHVVDVFSEDLAINGSLRERVMTMNPDALASLYSAITDEKTIVFVQAAQTTGLLFQLFNSMKPLRGRGVFQIQSRMTQPARVKALTAFAQSSNGILFSSDVGARGLDVDDVQHVIQFGMPADADTYVHRVGRTARAGKSGDSLLMLFPWEKQYFLEKIIPRLSGSEYHKETLEPSAEDALNIVHGVERFKRDESYEKVVKKGYQGFMGFTNSYRGKKRNPMSPEQMVKNVNDVLSAFGDTPPELSPKAVGKMGLRGVRGINVEKGANRGNPRSRDGRRRRH